MTKENIVVIGWHGPKFNVKGLSDGFARAGHKVIRIAADMETADNSGMFDYHLIDEAVKCYPYKPKEEWKSIPQLGYFLSQQQMDLVSMLQYSTIRFPLYGLIKQIEEKVGHIDRILVGQSDLLLDMTGLEYYYYFTEDYKPMIPFGGKLRGIFYAFVGGDENLKRSFGYEYNHCEFKPYFVPHGMDFSAVPSSPAMWDQRTIGVGFKGLLHFNQKSRDLKIRHMYDERRTIVQYCDQLLNSPEWIKDHKLRFKYEKHTTWDDYIQFMSQTQIALNISGIDGWVNQRQFEALAFGCVLLQYAYPELHKMGFIDGINCLLFENEEQLKNKLEWVDKYPEKAAKIAEAGHQLFIDAKMAWQDRADEMMNVWNAPPSKSWLDWQKTMNDFETHLYSKLSGKRYYECNTTTPVWGLDGNTYV